MIYTIYNEKYLNIVSKKDLKITHELPPDSLQV